jgi:hypothetical protein
MVNFRSILKAKRELIGVGSIEEKKQLHFGKSTCINVINNFSTFLIKNYKLLK